MKCRIVRSHPHVECEFLQSIILGGNTQWAEDTIKDLFTNIYDRHNRKTSRGRTAGCSLMSGQDRGTSNLALHPVFWAWAPRRLLRCRRVLRTRRDARARTLTCFVRRPPAGLACLYAESFIADDDGGETKNLHLDRRQRPTPLVKVRHGPPHFCFCHEKRAITTGWEAGCTPRQADTIAKWHGSHPHKRHSAGARTSLLSVAGDVLFYRCLWTDGNGLDSR